MSAPASGRWRGWTSSIASSLSSPSFRAKYDTNVRSASAPSLAQPTRTCPPPTYHSLKGRLRASTTSSGAMKAKSRRRARHARSRISAIAATWADRLKGALAASTDGMRARMLTNRYAQAFSGGYTEVFTAEQAIADITTVEKLTPARPVTISVHRLEGEDDPRRFGLKVFSDAAPLSLSYRVPVIENHGLRVVNERTYQIVPRTRPAPVWLHDMTIETSDSQPIEINPEFSHRLEASIMAVVTDRAESDGYNALILRTALGWRKSRPSGRCPATCTRSALRSARTICGRPCARTPRSRPAWSRCSRPARSTPRLNGCRALGARDGPACRDRGAAQIRRLAR